MLPFRSPKSTKNTQDENCTQTNLLFSALNSLIYHRQIFRRFQQYFHCQSLSSYLPGVGLFVCTNKSRKPSLWWFGSGENNNESLPFPQADFHPHRKHHYALLQFWLFASFKPLEWTLSCLNLYSISYLATFDFLLKMSALSVSAFQIRRDFPNDFCE